MRLFIRPLNSGYRVFLFPDIVLLAAVSYLFLRRLFVGQVKYISIASDYFPLFLIFGIAFSGVFMRYVTKVDVTAVKELTLGLVTFRPTIPDGVDAPCFSCISFLSAPCWLIFRSANSCI